MTAMWERVKYLSKRRDIQLVFTILINILLWWGALVLPSNVGAWLLTLASFSILYLVFALIWEYVQSPLSQEIKLEVGRVKFLVRVVMPILICLAIGIPMHSHLVTYVEQLTGKSPNAYVKWTSTPYPNLGIGDSSPILLVEVGAERTVIKNIDIELDTGNKYKETRVWFDSPGLIRRQSVYTVGPGIQSGSVEIDDTNPPCYIYKDSSHYIVPGETSLYIYFEGESSMIVRSVTVNGKSVIPVQGLGSLTSSN